MPDGQPLDGDLVRGEDGVVRCARRLDEPAGRAYHDAEFGRPSADDAWVFEKLVLEVFSATRPRRVTPAWTHEHPSTPESTAMAHELKRRGFAVVGPVVAYGLMQGTGVVDDHLAGCEVGEGCRRERAAFDPPRRAGGQGR